MKLTIDTDLKTIKVESQVPLDELLNTLKKLFPDNAWKEYKLEPTTQYHYYPYYQPYNPPYVYYGTSPTFTTSTTNSGTTVVDFNKFITGINLFSH